MTPPPSTAPAFVPTPDPGPAPDFYDWFCGEVHQAEVAGTPIRAISVAAGFPPSTFWDMVNRKGAYPRTQERLAKICTYFNAPPGWPAVWAAALHERDVARKPRKATSWHEATCAGCPKVFRFYKPPSHSKRREGIYCSKACQHRAALNRLSPKKPLGIFLDAERRKADQTVEAFAREIGVAGDCLRGLLKDALPSQKNLDRFKAFFGDGLPETATSTEILRARMNGPLAEYRELSMTPEARRKAASTMRGKKQSDQHIENLQVARRKTGGDKAMRAGADAYRASLTGKLEISLRGRLRKVPTPSESQLAEWAKEAAEKFKKLGASVAIVRGTWTDYMVGRGLLKGSEKYQRHLLICVFRNREPRPRWRAVAQKFPYFSNTRAAHGMWHRDHPSIPPCGVKKA